VKSLLVSYKGKNLNRVLEIVKEYESKYARVDFFYQINFRKKGIELSGNV
jgi:uncharacterized protein YpiB (UPF0302 family)